MNGSLDKQRIVSSVNIVMHVAIILSLTLSITLVRVERIMLTFDYLQMCTMIIECVGSWEIVTYYHNKVRAIRWLLTLNMTWVYVNNTHLGHSEVLSVLCYSVITMFKQS